MIGTFGSLLLQAGLFVLGVYIEKFARKRLFTRDEGKRFKQTTRIITCAIMTLIILLANYHQVCAPSNIGFQQCYYLSFHPSQILQVIIANTLLFGMHIYQKFIASKTNYSSYSFKSVVVAPFLEQLLFRASFARTASDQIPTWILSFIFSVSHLHKGVRKWIKGKNPNWNSRIGQIIFTFIFGVYSFYFLNTWKSVIPSFILHCYCNLLGPPMINKTNKNYHLACIGAMITYCYLFI